MENASKALLIAAGVLIAVILTTFGIKVTTSSKGAIEQSEEIGETMQETSQGAIGQLQTSLGVSAGAQSGNKEEILSQIKIGDKVAYDEGSGKTSAVDSSFKMDNLEWRVLGIESNGIVKLISTQPTTSKLTLSGEEGYLKGEENLDKLCNDLYANGTGVTARSLKIEDINKLAGIVTDAKKQELNNGSYSDYGNLWRYKNDEEKGIIQYSKSTDNGKTWSAYTNTSYSQFKEPGKENLIVSEQKHTYYDYKVEEKVTKITLDEIRVSDLLTKGLNNSNRASSLVNKSQWLSSCCVDCYPGHVRFYLRCVINGKVGATYLCDSNNYSDTPPANAIRPVVLLPVVFFSEQIDGVWQVK